MLIQLINFSTKTAIVTSLFVTLNIHLFSQRKNLIFECTFDSANSIKQWYEQSIYNPWSAVIVNNPVRNGQGSLKVELIRDIDTTNGPRAELGMPPQKQNESWYGFSNFFPADYASDPATEIVNQWQALPDFNLGENWRSPPLALEIKNDRFKIAIRWSSKPVNTNETANTDYLDIGPVIHNKWIDWVFHVKWNHNNLGTLQIWENNTLILERLHKPIGYNDLYYPYFKAGIYKWEWHDPLTISTSKDRKYYIDEVRAGNSLATYNDVRPQPYKILPIKYNDLLQVLKNNGETLPATFISSSTRGDDQFILYISEGNGETFYPAYSESAISTDEGKTHILKFKST